MMSSRFVLLVVAFTLCVTASQAKSTFAAGSVVKRLMDLIEGQKALSKKQAATSPTCACPDLSASGPEFNEADYDPETWEYIGADPVICTNTGKKLPPHYGNDGWDDCGDCSEEQGCVPACVVTNLAGTEPTYEYDDETGDYDGWIEPWHDACWDTVIDEFGDGATGAGEPEASAAKRRTHEKRKPPIPQAKRGLPLQIELKRLAAAMKRDPQCLQDLPADYICDGDNDCEDCSDEPNDGTCDKPCEAGKWRPTDFECGNGVGYLPVEMVCDGYDDCGDCSDESAGCSDNSCAEAAAAGEKRRPHEKRKPTKQAKRGLPLQIELNRLAVAMKRGVL